MRKSQVIGSLLVGSTLVISGVAIARTWMRKKEVNTDAQDSSTESPPINKPTKGKSATAKADNASQTSATYPTQAKLLEEFFNGYKVYTGAKGGKYYVTETGAKVYIKDKDKDKITQAPIKKSNLESRGAIFS